MYLYPTIFNEIFHLKFYIKDNCFSSINNYNIYIDFYNLKIVDNIIRLISRGVLLKLIIRFHFHSNVNLDNKKYIFYNTVTFL